MIVDSYTCSGMYGRKRNSPSEILQEETLQAVEVAYRAMVDISQSSVVGPVHKIVSFCGFRILVNDNYSGLFFGFLFMKLA